LFLFFQAPANWRALSLAAVAGATLGLTPAAVYLAASHDAPEPGAVRVPISSIVDAAQAAPVATDVAHTHERLLLAYSGPDILRPAVNPAVGAPAPFRSSRSGDLDCLTQAIYFEARGETLAGQAAVAQVVLNRVHHPAFPKTVCGVVYQRAAAGHGCQFSFACDGSVRRGMETGAWNRARRVAANALAGAVMPQIGAATHFHAVAAAPDWGVGFVRVAQVGLHVFYRLSGTRGGNAAPKPARAAPEPDDDVVFTALPASAAATPAVTIEAAPPVPRPAAAAAASPTAADAAKPALAVS
jgi:hypothetical protein